MSTAITETPKVTGASSHERCPSCGEPAAKIAECGECAARMCEHCSASKGLCELCDVDLVADAEAFGAWTSASYNECSFGHK